MSRPPPPLFIENKDYILRPPGAEDVLKIKDAFEKSVQELRAFMVWAHYPTSTEELLERVIDQQLSYFKGKEYELGMFDKKNGEFLSYIGFYPVNRINPQCMEIGFWTKSNQTGKGLATLCTQMVVALIFEYFKGDRIEITCSIQNDKSKRVIEKCGFNLEGKLRNFYPLGTEDMFKNGYIKQRSALLFSLIPEDIENLDWYDEIRHTTRIGSLLKEPISLNDLGL